MSDTPTTEPLTVREYRNLQAEGIADPLSAEQVEIRRLRKELEERK